MGCCFGKITIKGTETLSTISQQGMKYFVYVAFLLSLTSSAYGQIQVETDILNGDGTQLQTQLPAELNNQGIDFIDIVQSTDMTLNVQACEPGTYSAADGSSCVLCPAGTANPLPQSPNIMSCQTCSAGSWSHTGSSLCTDCPANTFSNTAGSTDASQCIACPADSSSSSGSNQVDDCMCSAGFFLSVNRLMEFDPVVTTLDFLIGSSIDVPHVSC
jgi:hypothetical protein